MLTFSAILIFIIGLIIGSFLNVLILRMDDLRSVLYDRSHCPSCKQVLKWYDMIPFLSFFLLKARCRFCSQQISIQYPLVELFTGLMFVFLYLMLGLNLGLFFYFIVFSILVVVLVYDLKTQTVPEIFVWIALALSALLGWYFGGFSFYNSLLGAIIAGGFLAILVFISKERWMGAGDIKLGLTLGFLLGYPNAVVGLFLAFVLGSIVGIAFVALKKSTMKGSLPFAPFLIISALITLVYGNYLVYWYLARFGNGYY